jgi:phenylpropionate dioxygenase-like ring-hydroxylating dioxygenase large terminal subunit
MHRQQTHYADIVKPDAVHGSVYLDPAIFADELRKIFDAQWVYVGHESEVPNTGDVKGANIGTQSVILCRDKQQSVQVLFNRCRHRAATVCQFERDSVKHFRCEYHGWTYDLDGTLTHVPYADGYEDLDKSQFGLLKPRHVEQYRGFYFACVEAMNVPLEEHLGKPVLDEIDLLCDQSPVGRISLRAGAARLTYPGNWKLQMENSIDGYHPNFAHQSWIKSIFKATGQRVAMFDGDSPARCLALGSGHTRLDYRAIYMAPTYREAQLKRLQTTQWGQAYYEALVTARGQERAEEVIVMGGTHMSVFPNLVILNNQVRNIRPLDTLRTDVDLAPALLEGVPDEVNTARLRAFEAFYTPLGGGIHDDIEMFNRVMDGIRGSTDAWLVFKRGLGREQRLEDGTLAGHVSDEVSQRAMWRHWLQLMSADVPRER